MVVAVEEQVAVVEAEMVLDNDDKVAEDSFQAPEMGIEEEVAVVEAGVMVFEVEEEAAEDSLLAPEMAPENCNWNFHCHRRR